MTEVAAKPVDRAAVLARCALQAATQAQTTLHSAGNAETAAQALRRAADAVPQLLVQKVDALTPEVWAGVLKDSAGEDDPALAAAKVLLRTQLTHVQAELVQRAAALHQLHQELLARAAEMAEEAQVHKEHLDTVTASKAAP